MVRSKESLEEEYHQVAPNSRAQWERSQSVMPGGMIKGAYWYPPYPVYMERGEGCYLWDLDGRRYVDFGNHHTTMILGHSPRPVVEALEKQLKNGIAFGAPTTLEAEISEEICKRVSSVESVRFTNSGTEASLHATRLVRAATGKTKIAKFEGAYHGSHDALEISVHPPLDQAGPPESPNSVPAWKGMARDCAGDTIILPYNQPESVELILREHRYELAAVFYEGIGGTSPFDIPEEFTRFVRRITEDLGLLMVLDEVVSFRAGYGGYQGVCGVKPDLTLFGKVIGGGLPVGALGGRADLMDLLDNTHGPTSVSQSGTFSGNALTLAAGLATLKVLTPEVYQHLEALGARLQRGLTDVFRCASVPAQVINRGSLVSVYLTERPVVDYRSMATSDQGLTHRLFLGLLLEGFFTSKLTTALSTPMGSEHIDGFVAALGRVLEQRDR